MGESERIRTRTTDVWVDDAGVLHGRESPGTETSLEDAKELIAAFRKVSGRIRRPLVMYISESKSVTREARAYLTGDEMESTVVAIGLVVGSALARALGNFTLRFNRPKFAVRLFESEGEAQGWAETFLAR
jgi:hypothetical protein